MPIFATPGEIDSGVCAGGLLLPSARCRSVPDHGSEREWEGGGRVPATPLVPRYPLRALPQCGQEEGEGDSRTVAGCRALAAGVRGGREGRDAARRCEAASGSGTRHCRPLDAGGAQEQGSNPGRERDRGVESREQRRSQRAVRRGRGQVGGVRSQHPGASLASNPQGLRKLSRREDPAVPARLAALFPEAEGIRVRDATLAARSNEGAVVLHPAVGFLQLCPDLARRRIGN